MPYVAGVALLAVCVAIATMMALQALSFLRGRSIITRQHFLLRMASGTLLMAVIVGIFGGCIIHFSTPLRELAYWAAVVVAAVGVAGLALADLRLTERAVHLRRAELYSQLSKLEDQLREIARRAKEDDNGKKAGEGQSGEPC